MDMFAGLEVAGMTRKHLQQRWREEESRKREDGRERVINYLEFALIVSKILPAIRRQKCEHF